MRYILPPRLFSVTNSLSGCGKPTRPHGRIVDILPGAARRDDAFFKRSFALALSIAFFLHDDNYLLIRYIISFIIHIIYCKNEFEVFSFIYSIKGTEEKNEDNNFVNVGSANILKRFLVTC
jgi:hypothetical protein